MGCGTYLNNACTCTNDDFVLELNVCLSAYCDATDVKSKSKIRFYVTALLDDREHISDCSTVSKDLHVKICHGDPV